ncbi:MAG: CPBP family intramembrane metalloprotease [Gammaproteobacteria bacterium]|nr:MAG: CPBP family intramembrane metalloprotease [Gammaproteobacteria bacterium]
MLLNAQTNNNDPDLAPSQRRLQRAPDFTGNRLSSFRAVVLRHGLPGAMLGALCLLHPDMRALLTPALTGFLADPARYLGIAALMFAALVSYAWFIDRRLNAAAVGWILYLLLISIWEEWVFRLALPYFAAENGMELRTAVIASNVLFGAAHYFTLRWKWQWCVAAALGGMALSRNFAVHYDLVLVIGIHWLATFVNTPRLPGGSRAA